MAYLGVTRSDMQVALKITSASGWRHLLQREAPLPSWVRYELLVELLALSLMLEEYIKDGYTVDPTQSLPEDLGTTPPMRGRWDEWPAALREKLVVGAESRVTVRGWIRGASTEQQRAVRRKPEHARHLYALPN